MTTGVCSGGGATEEEFAKYVELKKAFDAIKADRAPAEKQFKEALAKWQVADA